MNKTLLALQKYTEDFYAKTEFGESNLVGSPLGSWLLVASIASGLSLNGNSSLKADLESSLHIDVEEAEEAVKEILEKYRELNYVSQAWTIPDLSELPAVKDWVEANSLIPHEGNIPSQEQIDEWASTNTNGLIKEFPSSMDESVLLVIANIIYSKLAWKTKFIATPKTEPMKDWDVETVLTANATNDVKFFIDSNNDVFAVYKVKAIGDRESVSLVTCLSSELSPQTLMRVANNPDSMKEILPADERLLQCSENIYRIKEVVRGSVPTEIHVTVPAWEAESLHKLIENKSMGYQAISQALREGATTPFATDAKQVAVAKFDKDGFEAAALTTMIVSRCALPTMVTKTVYELNFTKPFVFISHIEELPVFSGYICKANEA